MWLLTGLKEENKDQIHYIYESKEYTVSRKGGDVTLSNDQSISRLHAKIIHGTQEENQILVMDAGSKYGTFLFDGNEAKKKLTANEAIALKPGCVVQFGLQYNVFRLDYLPLVVCPSTLNSAEKSLVKEIVEGFNGKLVSDWEENITHLTMNKITLTVKVVCALGYGKPIVNLDFWSTFKNAVDTSSPSPNYEAFIPPLAEKSLNKSKVSFSINPGRRELFAGKTFVASCPAQKQRVENMIVAAGGEVISWTDGKLKKEQLRDPKFLSLKPAPNEIQVVDSYHQLMKYLKDNDIRTISESEIGISVVYCSTEKYCNPNFDFNSDLVKTEASPEEESPGCLVPETQNSTKNLNNSEKVIPESAPLSTPANRSRSRLIDDFEDDEAEKTVIKTETMKSEAMTDVSRDLFATVEDSKPSTSRRISSDSSLSSSSSRKRPNAFIADDDEADVFNFGGRSRRRDSNRSIASEQNENKAPACENGKSSEVSSVNKKPRLCVEDPEEVFNFPSDRKASSKRKVSLLDDEVASGSSEKRRVSLLDEDEVFGSSSKRKQPLVHDESSSGSSGKRRISLLDDEVDSGSKSSSKRSRLDDAGTSEAMDVQRQPVTSWSQEMRQIDEQLNAVGFKSRQKPIKVEKSEDGVEENECDDEYVKVFRNKVVVETKDLMPARRAEPVETRQYDDGPNFKKFKKNKVYRVNVTKIIGKNNLRPFKLNDRQDIWGNVIEEEEAPDLFPQFFEAEVQAASARRGRAR